MKPLSSFLTAPHAGALALFLALIAPLASADETDHNLYYDPTKSNTTGMGGTGASSSDVWWTGSARHTWATGSAGSIATYWNLYFGGAGQVAPYTYTTALSTTTISGPSSSEVRMLSLIFQGDYLYTKTSSQTNTSTIGGSGSYGFLSVLVDPNKTLTVVAGTDTAQSNRIAFVSAANNSINPSLILGGGGTINLGQNADLTQTNNNGQIRVGQANEATTLNLNAGSTLNAKRLQIAAGTVNLNGIDATLAGSTGARGNSALLLGGNGTADEGYVASTFNLNGGSLTALAGVLRLDPNNEERPYGQGAHGIAIGVHPVSSSITDDNSLVGGTFNLNAGTLTTTDIFANPYATEATTAKFVFNGGTLFVASAATQEQLDGFIRGFQDTTNNHVQITSAGAFINTGSIDTANTNGTATISAPMQGAGSLTKAGANTLVLTGANTYSGGTVISAGTLAGNTSGLQGSIQNNTALIFNQDTDGAYAGVISGPGTVTKSGTGTVTLSGVNTFSGGTVISGGTLHLTGQVMSSVSVAGGALSGSGRISSTASLAADGRLAFELTSAPAVLQPLRVDQSLTFAPGATLALSGTGIAGGNTWTLITAGSFSGPLPQLSLPSGWQGSLAVVGNELRFMLEPLTTAFETWREFHFGSPAVSAFSAATADPDLDGWTNLVEYALGLDPLESDGAAALAQDVINGHLTLTFQRRAEPDLIYRVEATDTLGTEWITIWTSSGEQNTAGPVTVTDTVTLNSRPARFLRLQIETAAW